MKRSLLHWTGPFLPVALLLVPFRTDLQSEGVAPGVLQAEKDRIAVIEKVSPSVVAVMAKGAPGGGSGVLVSADGYALTNFHVTSAAGDEMHGGLPDGKLYDAVVVGIDPTGDVAIIKLRGREDFPFAPMGNSDELQVGDWTLAMGNPFMLAMDFKPTVTFGIISGLHRYQYPGGRGLLEYPDCIQVDASINPGNSGGPLFNMKGELVGINGRISFEKRARVNSGFGYAVSINQIKNFFPALRGGRVVDHATLGATVGTDDHGRVVVRDILGDSDAYRRGLRVDDEVVSLADRPISSVNEFKNVLGTLPSNWRVPLVIHRGTERMELLVRLSGQHGSNWDFPTRGQPQPPVRVKPPENKPELKKPDDKPQEGKKPDEGKPAEEKAPEEEPPGDPKPEDGQPGEEKPEEKGIEPKAPDEGQPGEPKPEEKNPAPQEPQVQPKPETKPGLIEKRPGFANFVFNRKEQERVLAAFSACHRKKADLPVSTWQLDGKIGQVPFLARLKDDAGILKIGESDFAVGKEDLMDPAGDDGIAVLRGLMLWRSFLLKGKEAFPDTHYDGRAPTPFGLCDVLVSAVGPVRITWYVLPETGALQVAEVCFERFTDPYEFLLAKYEEYDGLLLPNVLFVRVGDDLIGKFTVTDYDLGKSGEEPKETPPGDLPK